MHLGHAFAALFAWHEARRRRGRFVVRIEDIDHARTRRAFEDAIFEDLIWLGLDWDGPVRRQSEHMDDYAAALARLDELGVIYPCFCSRSEIRREIERAGEAPHGPDGPVYPGTCRALAYEERRKGILLGEPHAWRLDMARALDIAGALEWTDRGAGRQLAEPAAAGDVVVARKDVPTSYHLAVTVDDHIEGVTLVTRGEDLFHATAIHRLLQALLGLDVPLWHHHPLITDANGVRLAKRNRAMTLRSLRQAGRTPAEVRAMVGFE
jgi:glutamyl-Q tRNA(Asp) synthetase